MRVAWGFTGGPVKVTNTMKLSDKSEWVETTDVTTGSQPPRHTSVRRLLPQRDAHPDGTSGRSDLLDVVSGSKLRLRGDLRDSAGAVGHVQGLPEKEGSEEPPDRVELPKIVSQSTPADDATICRMYVPADAEDAAYRMIPMSDVKMIASAEPLPAERVDSCVKWWILKWLTRKHSPAW